MPSAQDRQLQDIIDALVAPGGPLETVPFAAPGGTVATLRHAPPSLAHFIDAFCTQHADLPFIVEGELRLSFGEVGALAHRVAAGLIARHGVVRGARVGIAARNSANWIVLYLGVLIAGGCATLLNGWWTGPELAEAIALAECELVFADAERAARLEGQPHGAHVVTFAPGAPEAGLAELLAPAAEATPPELTGDDLATILFTSGSTGKSKAAWSSHRAVVHAALSYAGQAMVFALMAEREGHPLEGQPATLLAVPLFHVTGEVPVLLVSLVLGRKLVIMPRWDAGVALRLIAAERVSYFIGVPLMSREIAAHPERDQHDLSSCRHFAAGGAPRPPAHVEELRARLPHAYPLLGYGLTETNAVGCGTYNDNYLAKPASTGLPTRPLVELSILGPDHQPLPQGTVGEVAIRSVCNIGGYWRDEAATAAAITADGFVLSGDLGYLDEDGYLFIVDRAKDVVIRGGENIACIEVEQALYAHPDVAEVTVFGVPDARLGEVPVAVWHGRPGHSLDAEALRTFVAARIAAFKVPMRFIESPEPLPRSGTEKIDKRALRASYAASEEHAKPAP